jgi:hypothetical protein
MMYLTHLLTVNARVESVLGAGYELLVRQGSMDVVPAIVAALDAVIPASQLL